MATKREAPAKKKTTSKKAAVAPTAIETGGAAEISTPPPAAGSGIDPDVRRQLIATEAFYIAERRGFVTGHESDDWAAAEVAVDSRLRETDPIGGAR